MGDKGLLGPRQEAGWAGGGGGSGDAGRAGAGPAPARRLPAEPAPGPAPGPAAGRAEGRAQTRMLFYFLASAGKISKTFSRHNH